MHSVLINILKKLSLKSDRHLVEKSNFWPILQTPFHDDMLKKEEELAARERALSEREKAYGVADPRPNNFPPLPAWCPVKPCFYHNIKDEIPPSEQWMMRLILILWGCTLTVECMHRY